MVMHLCCFFFSKHNGNYALLCVNFFCLKIWSCKFFNKYQVCKIMSKTAKMASVHLCWLLVLFLVLRYEENSIQRLQIDSSIFRGKDPCQQYFQYLSAWHPPHHCNSLKVVDDKENRDNSKTLTSREFEGLKAGVRRFNPIVIINCLHI